MNSITIYGHEYKIPSKWEELSHKQLVDVCAVMGYYHSLNKTTPEEWRYIREELLRILLDFPKAIVRHSTHVRRFITMPEPARVILLNHPDILPWLFDKMVIANYPISELQVSGKLYVGPKEDMLDVTVEDMIACHISATLYESTKDEKHLIELIAHTYRPVDKNYKHRSTSELVADRRVHNNVYEQEEREQLFAKALNPAELMAIYVQYCSHLESFTKRYPLFFKAAEKKKQEGAEALPDLQSYFLLVKSLSGGRFGNYQETRKTSADLFFHEVEEKIQANIDAKFNK